ncbi:hypothetical protein H6504_01865 [Candidatus Woesearchaeota archaeon]|nr:hypothetical protein [Candidatus Woesearchaeota archaeon]
MKIEVGLVLVMILCTACVVDSSVTPPQASCDLPSPLTCAAHGRNTTTYTLHIIHTGSEDLSDISFKLGGQTCDGPTGMVPKESATYLCPSNEPSTLEVKFEMAGTYIEKEVHFE